MTTPGKIKYMAQWYENDAFDYEGDQCVNFNPDVMHTSYYDTLDNAKCAAFKNASRHDCVGWAAVHGIQHPLSSDDDLFFVNEIYKGRWSGWKQTT